MPLVEQDDKKLADFDTGFLPAMQSVATNNILGLCNKIKQALDEKINYTEDYILRLINCINSACIPQSNDRVMLIEGLRFLQITSGLLNGGLL